MAAADGARQCRATVTVADRLDPQTPYDLLLVTLLAHQAEPLLPAAQALKEALAFCTIPNEIEGAYNAWRAPFTDPEKDAAVLIQGFEVQEERLKEVHKPATTA